MIDVMLAVLPFDGSEQLRAIDLGVGTCVLAQRFLDKSHPQTGSGIFSTINGIRDIPLVCFIDVYYIPLFEYEVISHVRVSTLSLETDFYILWFTIRVYVNGEIIEQYSSEVFGYTVAGEVIFQLRQVLMAILAVLGSKLLGKSDLPA